MVLAPVCDAPASAPGASLGSVGGGALDWSVVGAMPASGVVRGGGPAPDGPRPSLSRGGGGGPNSDTPPVSAVLLLRNRVSASSSARAAASDILAQWCDTWLQSPSAPNWIAGARQSLISSEISYTRAITLSSSLCDTAPGSMIIWISRAQRCAMGPAGASSGAIAGSSAVSKSELLPGEWGSTRSISGGGVVGSSSVRPGCADGVTSAVADASRVADCSRRCCWTLSDPSAALASSARADFPKRRQEVLAVAPRVGWGGVFGEGGLAFVLTLSR